MAIYYRKVNEIVALVVNVTKVKGKRETSLTKEISSVLSSELVVQDKRKEISAGDSLIA